MAEITIGDVKESLKRAGFINDEDPFVAYKYKHRGGGYRIRIDSIIPRNSEVIPFLTDMFPDHTVTVTVVKRPMSGPEYNYDAITLKYPRK